MLKLYCGCRHPQYNFQLNLILIFLNKNIFVKLKKTYQTPILMFIYSIAFLLDQMNHKSNHKKLNMKMKKNKL